MMEAIMALAILSILTAVSLSLAAEMKEAKVARRNAMTMRADLTTRAERLRSMSYEELASGQRQAGATVELAGCRYRLTTSIAEVDPTAPGLLRIALSGELLDDQDQAQQQATIELMKARRSWNQ
jgi:hypothetical protein